MTYLLNIFFIFHLNKDKHGYDSASSKLEPKSHVELDQSSMETSTKISSQKIESDSHLLLDRLKIKSQLNSSNANNSSNNSGRDANVNDDGKSASNNSFVIIKLETQHLPYVSLQFIFHNSINYYDRIRLMEKFKDKLRDLNMKNMYTSSGQQHQQPVSSSSMTGSINSTLQYMGNLPSSNLSFEDTQKLNENEDYYEFCQVNEILNTKEWGTKWYSF